MTDPKPFDLIKQEADMLEAGMAFQAENLKLLLAEMQALKALLPHGEGDKATAAETDAGIEEGFDNMPV